MTHNFTQALAAAAPLLAGAIAGAADTPEIAEQKRQLAQAYHVAHASGVCEVFAALRAWQRTDWSEGDAAVSQFLADKLLPRFTPDPAVLKDKPAAELETEFGRFCDQSIATTTQGLDELMRAPPETSAEALRFRDTLLAATFLGQCQTTSSLYLQGVAEHKNLLRKFVVAQVFSKDEKYRHEEIDLAKIEGGETGPGLDQAIANEEREQRYWSDCDTAEAGFKSIFEKLAPAP